MRTTMMLKIAALCLAVGFGVAGCSSSSHKSTSDMKGGSDLAGTDILASNDGGGSDAGDAAVGTEDFEDFVVGLINTQTSGTTLPTAINGRTFTDSMDPAKFAGLF